MRTFSLWSAVAGVTAFAVMFGLQPWVILLAVFGLLFAGINRALSRRVEEWFERKPDLRLAGAQAGELDTNVTSAVLRPWPFDLERVVAREIARLEEEADTRDAMARSPGRFAMYRAASPLVTQPRAEEYDRAREKFGEELETHAAALREWLIGYREAGDQRSRTFDLPLMVTSGKRGAYAEDVSLAIDLPLGVEVVDEWPTVTPPLEPPTYLPPRPRDFFDIPRPIHAGIEMPVFSPLSVPQASIWQLSADGRHVEMKLGAIHHGRSIELSEPLMVRAPGVGRYTLRWTLYARNGRRHCTGTLELTVPPTPERLPFKKLHGMETYPDVPFVDGDGEVVRAARTDDPPTSPPDLPAGDSALDWLLEGRAYATWYALGLADEEDDPAKSDAVEDDVGADIVNLDDERCG